MTQVSKKDRWKKKKALFKGALLNFPSTTSMGSLTLSILHPWSHLWGDKICQWVVKPSDCKQTFAYIIFSLVLHLPSFQPHHLLRILCTHNPFPPFLSFAVLFFPFFVFSFFCTIHIFIGICTSYPPIYNQRYTIDPHSSTFILLYVEWTYSIDVSWLLHIQLQAFDIQSI